MSSGAKRVGQILNVSQEDIITHWHCAYLLFRCLFDPC